MTDLRQIVTFEGDGSKTNKVNQVRSHSLLCSDGSFRRCVGFVIQYNLVAGSDNWRHHWPPKSSHRVLVHPIQSRHILIGRGLMGKLGKSWPLFSPASRHKTQKFKQFFLNPFTQMEPFGSCFCRFPLGDKLSSVDFHVPYQHCSGCSATLILGRCPSG